MLKHISVIGFAAFAAAVGAASAAQDFPSKPIRIVTSPVGAGDDIASRLIAQGISEPLGQPVIVENRPTGVPPAETVLRATPDGYTILLVGTSFWVGPLLRDMGYDPVTSFSGITMLGREPTVVVIHPGTAATSLKELIALAKAKPASLNYGTGAAGSGAHLAGELFKSMAGVEIVRVPYKGAGPAANALVAGEVQLAFLAPTAVVQHVKSGRLRALAVTGTQRTIFLPDLPTVSASGVPGYEFVGLDGIYAPAKTPATAINRLNQEIVRYLRTPEAKEKFLAAGAELMVSTPAELAATLKSEVAKISKLIKSAGIKTD